MPIVSSSCYFIPICQTVAMLFGGVDRIEFLVVQAALGSKSAKANGEAARIKSQSTECQCSMTETQAWYWRVLFL
jgi:hypothetical protein